MRNRQPAQTDSSTGDTYPSLSLKTILSSSNLIDKLPQEQVDDIAATALEGWRVDRNSRAQWEERNAEAFKLALQVKEEKNFPWAKCSNVKFPLLTVAALQFLSRVSIMVKGKNLAKVDYRGSDPTGQKTQRCKRVSDHLSDQLLNQDRNWMDQDEQAKLSAAIVGSSFKKTWYDGIEGIVRSEHVPAQSFVVDYFCQDIERAMRITEEIILTPNAIREKVAQGLYTWDEDANPAVGGPEQSVLRAQVDEATGLIAPRDHDDVFTALEQHTWLDLDGDGYAEPYIVTVLERTGQCLRIVARFTERGVHRLFDREISKLDQEKEKAFDANQPEEAYRLSQEVKALKDDKGNHITRIDPLIFYSRILFVPDPQGGVYGLGLGSLVGPMNESVNTLVNQLIDAGTMSNTAGGFVARGVRMKAGANGFNPFEWKPVDSTGEDLAKSFYPLPVREPSLVLFQLLGMLVEYTERISGATDIMTGVSPGQNTPAETSRNTVEQGMMLFSGIYNRMWRGFRRELELFVKNNQLFFPTSPLFRELTSGPDAIVAPDDYLIGSFLVFPAASPEAVSKTQRREKAAMVHQLAGQEPGFNRYLVTKELLEAWDVDSIDALYPDPKGPNAIAPPPNPKMEIEKAKIEAGAQQAKQDGQLRLIELRQQAVLDEAKVGKLQAERAKLLAQAHTTEVEAQLAVVDRQLGMAKEQQESVFRALDMMERNVSAGETRADVAKQAKAGPGAGDSPAPKPQPAPEGAPR